MSLVESKNYQVPVAIKEGGADLGDLASIRSDVWRVLDSAPNEVPELLAALHAGLVDGSTYIGECACLVGTLEKAAGVSHGGIDGLRIDASSLAESWFAGIRKGDTPATNRMAEIAGEWIEEWIAKAERGGWPVTEAKS
jgi:hypothetical protein